MGAEAEAKDDLGAAGARRALPGIVPAVLVKGVRIGAGRVINAGPLRVEGLNPNLGPLRGLPSRARLPNRYPKRRSPETFRYGRSGN